MNDFPILTVLILVPLVGALAVAFLPATGDQPKRLGVLFSVLTLAVGVVLAASYDVGDGGLHGGYAIRPGQTGQDLHSAVAEFVAAASSRRDRLIPRSGIGGWKPPLRLQRLRGGWTSWMSSRSS